MQQGPSALPESQANLREYAVRWSAEARANGARLALLTVWPESYRRGALTEVIASYRRAATSAKAELLPAGDAWRRAWHCEPGTPLYGRDGFHPSELGTYTAALVVYGRLFERRSSATSRRPASGCGPQGSSSGRPPRRSAGGSRAPGAAAGSRRFGGAEWSRRARARARRSLR